MTGTAPIMACVAVVVTGIVCLLLLKVSLVLSEMLSRVVRLGLQLDILIASVQRSTTTSHTTASTTYPEPAETEGDEPEIEDADSDQSDPTRMIRIPED